MLQVYSVVDEMFLAGEIRETSQTKVLKQLLMLNSLEWRSVGETQRHTITSLRSVVNYSWVTIANEPQILHNRLLNISLINLLQTICLCSNVLWEQ